MAQAVPSVWLTWPRLWMGIPCGSHASFLSPPSYELTMTMTMAMTIHFFHILNPVSTQDLGQLEEAEALLVQSLEMRQRTLGPRDPMVANTAVSISACIAVLACACIGWGAPVICLCLGSSGTGCMHVWFGSQPPELRRMLLNGCMHL